MISDFSFFNLRLFFHSPLIHCYFKLELFHCILIQDHDEKSYLDYDVICTELCQSLSDKSNLDFAPQQNHILELNKQINDDINKEKQTKRFSAHNIVGLTSLAQLLVTETATQGQTEVVLPEIELDILLNVLSILQGPSHKDLFLEMSVKNSGKILWEQFFFVLINYSGGVEGSKLLYALSQHYNSWNILRKLLSVYKLKVKLVRS
jgi:hypothetical protein